MVASILTTIKKSLGVEDDVTAFDVDILMHINSVFSTLNQIGVGPDVGFQIEDSTATWDSFLGTDPRLNNVKTYIYLKVRLLFDPPSTSFTIKALEDMAHEIETRLYLAKEAAAWRTANPIPDPELTT